MGDSLSYLDNLLVTVSLNAYKIDFLIYYNGEYLRGFMAGSGWRLSIWRDGGIRPKRVAGCGIAKPYFGPSEYSERYTVKRQKTATNKL